MSDNFGTKNEKKLSATILQDQFILATETVSKRGES